MKAKGKIVILVCVCLAAAALIWWSRQTPEEDIVENCDIPHVALCYRGQVYALYLDTVMSRPVPAAWQQIGVVTVVEQEEAALDSDGEAVGFPVGAAICGRDDRPDYLWVCHPDTQEYYLMRAEE